MNWLDREFNREYVLKEGHAVMKEDKMADNDKTQGGVKMTCRSCSHEWVGEPGSACPACGVERPDIYGWRR